MKLAKIYFFLLAILLQFQVAHAQEIPFDHWLSDYLPDLYLISSAKISPFVYPPSIGQIDTLVGSIDSRSFNFPFIKFISDELNYYKSAKKQFDYESVAYNAYIGFRPFSSIKSRSFSLSIRSSVFFSSHFSTFVRFRATNNRLGIPYFSGRKNIQRMYFDAAEADYMFFQYRSKLGSLSLGRFKQTWGNFSDDSIFLSNYGPSCDGFRGSIKYHRFTLRFFAGYLETVVDSGSNVNRYIAAHMLHFNLSRFHFMIGETMLYSGKNRPFSIPYAIPLMTFLEADANHRFNQIADERDNAFLSLGISYRYPSKIFFPCELSYR